MLHMPCLCGRFRIEVTKRPDYIHECNCTLCRKSGARWAYYDSSEVGVTGSLRSVVREGKAEPAAEIHLCEICGSKTHFTMTVAAVAKSGNVQTGVNMSLSNESDLNAIEMRYPDGRAWSGGADFGYASVSHWRLMHTSDDCRSSDKTAHHPPLPFETFTPGRRRQASSCSAVACSKGIPLRYTGVRHPEPSHKGCSRDCEALV